MSTEIAEIIKKVAAEKGMTYSQVERIFYSQFKFVAHVIKEDREKKDRRSIRLMKFGTFTFVPRMVEIIEKNKNGKQGNGKEITEN